jgi:hypothetical protein
MNYAFLDEVYRLIPSFQLDPEPNVILELISRPRKDLDHPKKQKVGDRTSWGSDILLMFSKEEFVGGWESSVTN